MYPCLICKKVFDNTGALSSHQGWHKRGRAEKKLKTQEKLFRRMVNQIPPDIKPDLHTCPTCGSCFVNATALRIHVLEVHANVHASVRPQIQHCDKCQVDFETQDAYDKHIELHRIIEQQQQPQQSLEKNTRAPCKYCPAVFSRSDSLFAHVRKYHQVNEKVMTVR